MPKQKTVAEQLATKQKEISISEFFTRNRHLLGFDNPSRALLMTIKEAVDNSLDACSEMKVLPDLFVSIKQINETRFLVIVEDNGPGIVKQQIPNIFAKLLYGSKFHTLKQNRGQQGIGISASVLYSQLSTGKPTKIISKTGRDKPAHYYELNIDTKKNEPKVITDRVVDWVKEHGTKIEIELEGKYLKGRQSVDEYVKQTAIVNPHAQITYIAPDNEKVVYHRATQELPKESKEIKPHPHGIELGTFIKMLHDTTTNTIHGFFQGDFSRIGAKTASDVCNESKISSRSNPRKLSSLEAEKLFKALQSAKIMAPPTDCLSPIGSELLERGLRKEINAEFYVTTSRPTSVYRGMPFQIEVGIAYGGDLPKDTQVKLLRFANRVPLLYQQGACAITEAVTSTNWKAYDLQQSGSNLPVGPAVITVHMASVWVPFTSESKDAIASYDEILKEMRLALQECGRKLGAFIRRTIKAREQKEKIDLLEKYIPELASALSDLTDLKKEILQEKLQKVLKKELTNLEMENGKEE